MCEVYRIIATISSVILVTVLVVYVICKTSDLFDKIWSMEYDIQRLSELVKNHIIIKHHRKI